MRINNNDNGLVKGMAVGVGTFFILRRGPRIFQKWILQRQLSKTTSSSNKSAYKFDHSFSQKRDPFQTATGKISQPQQQSERPGLFLRTVKFGLDMFVSLSMAAYGAIIFSDKEDMIKEVAEIPLVEGRSLISDELCHDFYEQYRHYPRQVFENTDDVLLKSISGFVRNCLKRQAYERQIQQQNQEWSTDHNQQQRIYIPSPGVPQDTHVEIEWVNNYGKILQKKETNQENSMFDSELEQENRNNHDVPSDDNFTIQEDDDFSDEMDFGDDKNMDETNDGKEQERSWSK